MNLIATLTARIEDYRADNKNPCKNYATEAAAEKATAAMAAAAGKYFYGRNDDGAQPARYVVFYVAAWNRWVGCIDMTELLQRQSSTGGYIGFCKGFFSY